MIDINSKMTALEIMEILAKTNGGDSTVEHLGGDIFSIGGFTIKAVASKNYFHARNGESKIQIFYDSKANTETNLNLRFTQLLAGVPYENMAGETPMAEHLSKKLGVEVIRYKRDNEILYRVKGLEPFKSLSLSDDGKNINSCTFHNVLDSIKSINASEASEILKTRMAIVEGQHEAISNLLSLLDGE